MSKRLQRAMFAALMFGCWAIGSAAPTWAVTNDDVQKRASSESSAFGSINENAGPSIVRLRNQNGVGCLGILVAKNLVVSKRSELSGTLICIGPDGTEASGVIVGSNALLDLALVEVLPSAQRADSFVNSIELGSSRSVVAGDLLLSVVGVNDSVGVGLAIVDPQQLPIKQPRCRDCVDLGLTLGLQPAARQLKRRIALDLANNNRMLPPAVPETIYGAAVERVYPRTVSERVGVLRGDLLVSINGLPVYSAASLGSIGSRLRVGQVVSVLVVRDGQLKLLARTIERFSRRIFHDRWGGGPFSERRFGFGAVIVHDTLLKPDQCGGPLLDLNGNLVGVNISRSLRVATFAIPVAQVRQFVEAIRPDVLRDH